MCLLLVFQRVEDEYSGGGWTKHHGNMLEYEEACAPNAKPSISLKITEPADDQERKWKLTIVTSIPVSYTCTLLFVFELFDFHLSWLLHTFAPLWVCIFVSLYVTVWEISCGSANRKGPPSHHSLWHRLDRFICFTSFQLGSQDRTCWDEGLSQLLYHLPTQKSCAGAREEQGRYMLACGCLCVWVCVGLCWCVSSAWYKILFLSHTHNAQTFLVYSSPCSSHPSICSASINTNGHPQHTTRKASL